MRMTRARLATQDVCLESRQGRAVSSGGMMSRPVATHLAAAQPVLHVHRVVLAVGAPQAEEHRGPAPQAEPLLLERPGEAQLAAVHLVVLALASAARRSRTRGRAARRPRGSGTRQAHRAALRARGAGRRRPTRAALGTSCAGAPVKASLEPSPRTSTPARSRSGPDSSSRADHLLHGLDPADQRAARGRARGAVRSSSRPRSSSAPSAPARSANARGSPWPPSRIVTVYDIVSSVLSVNVAQIREIPRQGRMVPTGIWKLPVEGRCCGARRERRGRRAGGPGRARRPAQGRLRLRARGHRLVAGRARPGASQRRSSARTSPCAASTWARR